VKTVEGETNLRIHGSFTSEIGAEDDRRAVDTFVWGDGVLGASDGLRLRGDGSLILASGESRIELTPKGIVLHAPQITLGGLSVTVRGDGPALRLDKEAEITADAVRVYAAGSSLELEEDARLDGRTVKLNCGPLDPEEMVDEQGRSTLQHLRLRLTDVAMKPYAGKDYVLRAHGVRIDGKTDTDGVLEADLPAEAKTAEITLWIEPRPTGKTKRYVVELGGLAEPETVAGAESRLRNLGYFWGARHSEIAGDLARALRDFQQDHGIEPTGQLDAATRAKLVEIHGH
jgi:type VI secretion system secreted protein VgrG